MLNAPVPCFPSLYSLLLKINSKADLASHVGILQGWEDRQDVYVHYSEALYSLPCLKHDLKNNNI